jgi:DNA-binding NarL/FixJ family response regulator
MPKLRSCFRCGSEFYTVAVDRICPACRARKLSANRALGLREMQIVELVQQAKLNKEIAYELHLKEGTIKAYLNRIFRKLGVTNRTELAMWACRREKDVAEDCLPKPYEKTLLYSTFTV